MVVELLLQAEQEHRVQVELVEQEQEQVLMDHPLLDLVVEAEAFLEDLIKEQVDLAEEEQADLVVLQEQEQLEQPTLVAVVVEAETALQEMVQMVVQV